jgi:chromosome partitioning protein
MLMNAKGGCGKTTLATNIATWFADEGKKVALADFDTQSSSLDWLEARQGYNGVPEIQGIDATREAPTPARGTDYLIMDAPSGIHGKAINDMLRRVQTLILPVLPSPFDIRAGGRFIEELLATGRVSRKQTRIGVVANRVRENTLVFHDLEAFLNGLSIPVIGTLRESQNYIRSAERGLGLFELAPSMVWQDREQWDPIMAWLNSNRSLPPN